MSYSQFLCDVAYIRTPFSFIGMLWYSLTIIMSQLPLLFLQLGNPTKSWFDYNSLTKLQLLQLEDASSHNNCL